MIYDRHLSESWRWNIFGNAIALMPNSMSARIPYTSDDPISADLETLNRNTGAQLGFGTGIEHYFAPIGLIVGGGYNVQYLSRTSYDTTGFDPARVGYLEDENPEEVLHTLTATAGFSTVEWFKQKKFFYPMQANFTYSHPIAGINVSTSDLIAGELVLFF